MKWIGLNKLKPEAAMNEISENLDEMEWNGLIRWMKMSEFRMKMSDQLNRKERIQEIKRSLISWLWIGWFSLFLLNSNPALIQTEDIQFN